MDLHTELRDFLVSRRARLTPEAAGVQPFGGTRRVPGLRREEVAFLAGVSVDYYTRFERGRVKGVSDEVVDAVARALRLDDVERDHLHNLVHAARAGRRTSAARPARTSTPKKVPIGLQSVVDAITVPAFIQNARMDVLATNHLGRALYPFTDTGTAHGRGKGTTRPRPYNHARFIFLDPRAGDFYRDYDLVARNNVAILRAAAGRDPHEPGLIELVGQLSTQSEQFRELWAAQNVVQYRTGLKRYHHPLVGDVEFSYETFDMPAYPGLLMLVYTVERGSRTEEAMRLLASWTADELDVTGAESAGSGASASDRRDDATRP
jgi:transcriptional regulator with XRE-family HTH domain